MANNIKLPEELQAVEYIEYHPKQETIYVFGQFERYRDALELAKRINLSCDETICGINSFQIQDNVLFCIVFPEHVFEKIDYLKKEECNILNIPTIFNYNIPILYRFIEEKYIDSFMETGVLKLTTFDKCKKLEDENRKDDKEGRSDLYGYDGQYKFQIGFGVGSDVIMLCTSLCSDYQDSNGKIYKKYIEIFDIQGLLFSITEQLKKDGYSIISILFGPCFYSKKEFHKEVSAEKFREKLEKKQSFDWDELTKLTHSITGNDIYFQKPLDKRNENEFRIIWIVDNLKKDNDIFVTIPNPQKFCRIIETKCSTGNL